MKFRKVTANKYIGDDNLCLRRDSDGRFSIYVGSSITKWGTGFKTVRSAELFLEEHDYISASTDTIGISGSDLNFIEEMYGLDYLGHKMWSVTSNCLLMTDSLEGKNIEVTLKTKGEPTEVFTDMDSLLIRLDEIVENDIFASVTLRGTNLRTILAANNRRSPREITKNLVRVKSSNVWAYGIEIKDNKSNVGDVYVQFKGKDGGPNGGLYRYYDVPISTWRRILGSPSKGHAVWKYLRNNYLYSRLDGNKRGVLPNAVNH